MALLISIFITALYAGVCYYLTLPAINIQNPGFWVYIISVLIVFVVVHAVVLAARGMRDSKLVKGEILVVVAAILIFVVGLVASAEIFHAHTYANRIEVTEGVFEEDVPTVSDLNEIPLMDTASAKILGNRVVGTLSDLVSQYNVSDTYTTICYNGSVMKVAPLVYEGFIKYLNNKSEGIPGYVLVNTETNEAQFMRLDEGIQYSESAYFSKDLSRKLRFSYPNKIFGDYNFQIDNDGTPYWVVTCIQKKALFGASVPNEVIILNAITGESEIYDINDTPEWIDYVYSGYTISDLYNTYGTLQNGYINSIFGQKNCTQTTDDFGYVVKGDDVYVYTGITSTVSDESNLGFLLVNSRTGEFKYYQMSGAEEYSAMSAAEGAVQNFGYNASFPALININGEATYALVLKDDSGLVKLYAMVNVKNYTVVATGSTMSETLKNYKQAMNSAGKGMDISISEDSESVTFVIADLQFLVYNDATVCYIKDEDGTVYKQNFNENESLIQLNVGDQVTVTYDSSDSETGIYDILDIVKK